MQRLWRSPHVLSLGGAPIPQLLTRIPWGLPWLWETRWVGEAHIADMGMQRPASLASLWDNSKGSFQLQRSY